MSTRQLLYRDDLYVPDSLDLLDRLQPRSERGIVFSDVCLCACLSVNTIAPGPLEMMSSVIRDVRAKFSGHHPTVERGGDSKNGYRGARVVI